MSTLNVDGISLYYTVKGKGIPLVFIHPPVLTSVNFEYQVEELSPHFQVITFDIRGHGKSQYSNKPITFPLIVEDIKLLLDHLEVEKAFICGYSTGGSIVLEFLRTSPEHALGGIVIGGYSDVNDMYLRQKISLGIKLAKVGAISLLAWSMSKTNSNTQKLFKKLFTEARKGDARNIEQYFRYSLHYNCTDQLGNIDHPIMLVYGEKDKLFHRYAKQLHEKLPLNELKFIEKVNHRIPTKAANRLNEIITQFISQYL